MGRIISSLTMGFVLVYSIFLLVCAFVSCAAIFIGFALVVNLISLWAIANPWSAVVAFITLCFLAGCFVGYIDYDKRKG